ncbi:ferredoxin-type protein NapF [Pararhizobium capsulatum]|uniref:ferredoxin-type protein NapF n=1 Tax=Pararhizobium capsulatum TaxID=34014 RepID=UPI0027D8E19E|nr:ferredoxin-type protein NapF [Pararhizobium capsulatum]
MREDAPTRRSFLLGKTSEYSPSIRPPGTTPATFRSCTGCGLCVERCPTGVIKLADARPLLDFATAECTFCGECRLACPEPVFLPEGALRFDHFASITDVCLAKRDVACQSCGESCSENAIRFKPRLGGPFLPDLDEHACIGCGACVGVCPVSAITVKSRQLEAADA